MSQTEVQLIKAAAVVTGDIADQAVTLDKLPHGTSSNNGKFLRANNGADPTFETVSTDLVGDTSPQLGGNLDVNSKNIIFGDTTNSGNNRLKFGASGDLEISHNGSNSLIQDSGTGDLLLAGDNNVSIVNTATTEFKAKFITDGAVELYHDNTKKFETASHGATLTGNLRLPDNTSGNASIQLGDSQDFFMNHNGTDSFIINNTGDLFIRDLNGDVHIQGKDNEEGIIVNADGAVELYHDNVKKFETNANGAKISGTTAAFLEITTTSGAHNPMFRGSNGDRTFDTGLRGDTNDAWCVYDVTAADVRFMIDTSGNVKIPNDSVKLTVGAGDDLEIFHDGTHNEIRSNGAKTIHIRPKDSDVGIALVPDGEVELYYDNSLKLSTETYGVSLHGLTLSTAGNILYYNSSTGQVTYQSAPSSGAPLANDGNNRIVTATGSGGLNGESTLTYNGSFLTNTGNTSFNRNTTGFTADTGGSIKSSNVHVASAEFARTGSNGRIVDYYNTAFGGGLVASVQGNHGQGSFNNHSDYRSKENVTAITDGITQLKKLKPSRFNFISDPTKYVHDGFLAHEVTPAVPSAVSGEKDGMMPLTHYEEGDTIPEGKRIGDPKTYSTTEIEIQMLDYSKLTPLLTAALQETLTKVETLETKVAALEAA